MFIMYIQGPVHRTEKPCLVLIDPLCEGMIQKQRLSRFHVMFAKIDAVTKRKKTGITKAVNLIVIRGHQRSEFPRLDGRADGGVYSRHVATRYG